MQLSRRLAGSLAALCLALAVTCTLAHAQPAKSYKPEVGQDGKDVVWVPTAQTLVDKMLDMAKVTPQDYVIDLGSGDGRTVITAAKRGAKALGIEYEPDMVELSKRNAEKAEVGDKATFVKADIFASDFSQATVITMFLLPELNLRLRPTILNMKPGTRVVSNSFDMADWKPDRTVEAVKGCNTYCQAFLWIVPAQVEGTWQMPEGNLVLKQKFQLVSGEMKTAGVASPVTNGRLTGEEITFTAKSVRYTGRVTGNSMEGTSISGGKETPWRATREGG